MHPAARTQEVSGAAHAEGTFGSNVPDYVRERISVP